MACRVDADRLRVTRIDAGDLDPEAADRATEQLRATYDALNTTNAEARLDCFKAVVEEVVAGATLLDESRCAAKSGLG